MSVLSKGPNASCVLRIPKPGVGSAGYIRVRSRCAIAGRTSRAGKRPPCARPSLCPAIRDRGHRHGRFHVRLRRVVRCLDAGRAAGRCGSSRSGGLFPSQGADRGSARVQAQTPAVGVRTRHVVPSGRHDDDRSRTMPAPGPRRNALDAAAEAATRRSCLRVAARELLQL